MSETPSYCEVVDQFIEDASVVERYLSSSTNIKQRSIARKCADRLEYKYRHTAISITSVVRLPGFRHLLDYYRGNS